MWSCRLPGAGLAGLAPPRHHGDAGHAVHRRAAGGASAGPGIADTARHRRDAEGDATAQAARQGGAGRPDQPASRAQTQRHSIPLPLATQSSADVKEKRCWYGDFVKLSVEAEEREVSPDNRSLRLEGTIFHQDWMMDAGCKGR